MGRSIPRGDCVSAIQFVPPWHRLPQPSAALHDHLFADLPTLLPAQCHLVFNESKVFSARVFAHLPSNPHPETEAGNDRTSWCFASYSQSELSPGDSFLLTDLEEMVLPADLTQPNHSNLI